MSDNERPCILIDLDGVEFRATPENASLFTFLGHTVLESGEVIDNKSRSHVFLETGTRHTNDEGQEVTRGTYIFGSDGLRIGAMLLKLGFPATLNQRHIPESDEAAFQSYIEQQQTADELPNFFPEEWGRDGAA